MSNSKSTIVNVTLSAFLVTLSVAVTTAAVDIHKTIKNVNNTIEQVQTQTLPKVSDLLNQINQGGPNGEPGLIANINQAVLEINTVIKQLNGTELVNERNVLLQTVAQLNILLTQLNNVAPDAEDRDITQTLNSIKQLLGNAAEITAKVNGRITDDSSLQKAFLWNGRDGAAKNPKDDEDEPDPMQGGRVPSNSGWFSGLWGFFGG